MLLFQSTAGYSLSEVRYYRLLFASIQGIINNLRTWCLPMGQVSKWVVTVWPFLQPLLHPSITCREDELLVKDLWVAWCSRPSIGSPSWLQKVASSGSRPLLLGISPKITCIDSWEPPLTRSLGHFGDSFLSPNLSQLQISIHSPALWASLR